MQSVLSVRIQVLFVFSFFLFGCSSPKVIQQPIPFDEERAQLSIEYLKERYQLVQDEPTIVPQMVVVHWTVIPTFEKSYQAFYNSKLPGWRPELAGAGALNVSSQYLIDRDGQIYQLLPDTVFARHTIGLNHCAIGIENVGGGKDLPLTQAQLKANIHLIKKLADRHDIKYVIGHHEYQHFIGHPLWLETDPDYLTQKSDPGDDFMNAIRSGLTDHSLQPVPPLDVALVALKKAREQKKIEALRKKLMEDALERKGFVSQIRHYIEPDFTQADTYLANLQPDGSWSDVDYADRDNEWHPLVALDRMIVMTYAYSKPDDPHYQDPELLSGIVKALMYWYTVNPDCKNWYKNDIAKQFYFNVIGLLLQDHIDESLLTKITNDLTAEPSRTGSNRTLVAISVIYRGVIEKNITRINQGIAGVLDQVEITTKEGIQPDFSFHQHGAFIYNGSYGHNFLRETIWLASIVQGTDFSFSEEQLAILRNYYFEGTRWMSRGLLLDYNVRGRQVGRSSGFSPGADKIIPQLDRFILADPVHREIYQDAQQRIQQNRPQQELGNRHFWRSDYTAHHRNDYFTSLKMCSERTIGMEMDVNTENLYGYYLPYGLTYIYRRGDEYLDIFPAWDWARLPGVTSPHQAFSSKGKSTQQTAFVGGVSDGQYGVSAMDLDVQNTQAKKSWFWFDQEWVALGAGIQSTHEASIVTGVNQTNRQGEIAVNGIGFRGHQQTLKNPRWVWHDSVAYIFPDEQDVVLKATEQTGHLQQIFGLGADTTYRSDIFSLWFEHGPQPVDASYAYMVAPGLEPGEIEGYLEELPVRILVNNAEIQAVTHDELGLTGIVFHRADQIVIQEDLSVEVDRACLLLLDPAKETLTVSDPTTLLETITVTIRNGQGKQIVQSINLPDDGLAGQSVTVNY